MSGLLSSYRRQARNLLDAYEQVVPDLSHVIGYPVKLTRVPSSSAPSWSAFDSETIEDRVRYGLPGPGNRLVAAYISFPDEAGNDAFARKCIDRFVGFAERMARAVKDINDVKRILIKDEPLLWEDIIVSGAYPESVDKLNVMSLIAVARDSLYMRYEGRPLEQGILMTWDQGRLREESEKAGFSLLAFSREVDYRDAIRRSKSIFMLSDGSNSLLVVNPEGILKYLLRFNELLPPAEAVAWEIVPQKYRHLKSILLDQDLILVTTRHGELVLFNAMEVLKLAGNSWHRITGTPLSYYLNECLSPEVSLRLSEMLVEMSALKIGASLIITDSSGPHAYAARKGIARDFRGGSLGDIMTINRQVFLKIAAIDGCTIIGSDGSILNAGVILNIPDRFTKGVEGARAAATRYGSTFGLGIKVSADGPITVYENGVPQRNIA